MKNLFTIFILSYGALAYNTAVVASSVLWVPNKNNVVVRQRIPGSAAAVNGIVNGMILRAVICANLNGIVRQILETIIPMATRTVTPGLTPTATTTPWPSGFWDNIPIAPYDF